MASVFFTDGSNSTRTKKCGWAVYGRQDCLACPGEACAACAGSGWTEVRRCGYGVGTNQLAELMAVVYAMRLARPGEPTLIVSDSEYSINAVTTYRRRWEKSGYRNCTGNQIAYRDLVQYAHRLHDEKPEISFRHVRGHTGVEGNEIADVLSREARYVAEGRLPAEKLHGMLVGGE